ncbi:MAG TPA: hypothetical protein VK645_02305 [Chitinophagaceae bacterium]|nr:hypothetical protein [Chitinophagaceae bacterium]
MRINIALETRAMFIYNHAKPPPGITEFRFPFKLVAHRAARPQHTIKKMKHSKLPTQANQCPIFKQTTGGIKKN